MESTTTDTVIKHLQQIFVHHTTTAPYHPHSNGEAERPLQTFKQSFNKANPQTTLELQNCATNFLANYRAIPHSVTDQTLFEMLNNRRVCTRLVDLLHHSQVNFLSW